jgi:hypothetical protein
LEGTESESDWGFGQTTAVALLALTITELLSSIREYFNFEKKVENHEKIEDIEKEGDVKESLVGMAVEVGKNLVLKSSHHESTKSAGEPSDARRGHSTTVEQHIIREPPAIGGAPRTDGI